MSKPILDLQDVTIQFGGLIAVGGVSFKLQVGDMFGLIGPNGAGKTTCFNLITGVYKPTHGHIYFHGQRVDSLAKNDIAALGIARTFQNIRLFPRMTALDNVVVGAFLRHKTSLLSALTYADASIQETQILRDRALHWLEVLELGKDAHTMSTDLPYGKQRRLEIARAMATEPELLLLDEPAAGMNPQESANLLKVVRRLRDEFGKTVLLIEHDMKFVMNLCERIVVLDHGEEIAHGGPEDIKNHPKVIEAYLGHPL